MVPMSETILKIASFPIGRDRLTKIFANKAAASHSIGASEQPKFQAIIEF